MPTTRVVNLKREPYDVYIGRAMPGFSKSVLANPFSSKRDGSKAEVLAMYRKHLAELLATDPSARDALEALRGKVLGCWCKPYACHGDIILEAMGDRGTSGEKTGVKKEPQQAALF